MIGILAKARALPSAQPAGLALTSLQYEQVEACLSDWLAGRHAADPPCLAALGLRLSHPSRDIAHIEGATEGGRRHGDFLIRQDGEPIVVLAPHAMSDLRTGEIAENLFALARARAVLAGTVHRDGPMGRRSEGARKSAGFDLAHLDATFFQALVQALASHGVPPLFVELHGFDRDLDTREGTPRGSFDLIVGGGPRGGLDRPEVGLALQAVVGRERTGLYGVNVWTLGGTRNAQGKLLDRIAPGRFLHLEMSLALRRRLLRDRSFACAFVDALLGRLPRAGKGRPRP